MKSQADYMRDMEELVGELLSIHALFQNGHEEEAIKRARALAAKTDKRYFFGAPKGRGISIVEHTLEKGKR